MKLAGETLEEVLIPLHPLTRRSTAIKIRRAEILLTMMAPSIKVGILIATPICPGRFRTFSFYFGLAILLLACFELPSEVASPLQTYQETSRRVLEFPDRSLPAWIHARSCFDLAEISRDDKTRAKLAQEGISLCRRLIQLESTNAPAHYYLALNLGQLARTKKLAALKLVEEMERELKLASTLDPHFDHAGAHRSLGLLYHQAPGPPISIGSSSKAMAELKKAVELASYYPDNRLSLLEVTAKHSRPQYEKGREEWKEKLAEMRKQFSGPEWEKEWADWDRRWAALPSR